jgi:hypothetical protein
MHQCRERFESRMQKMGRGAGTDIGGALAAARAGPL